MKKLLALLILVPVLGLTTCTPSPKEEASNNTGYSTPEEEGISSKSILEFIEALEETQDDAIHSVMIRRHGNIVAQGWWAPYSPESPHLLWSLSKSFTSTAIGMAQDEGLLSIDDLVISSKTTSTIFQAGQAGLTLIAAAIAAWLGSRT